MSAILEEWGREGRWAKETREECGLGEGGKESEEAANRVNKTWIFFFLLFLVTRYYTALGRLIHNSSGSEHHGSNCRGNFLFSFFYLFLSILGCHTSVDQESLK